MSLINIDGVNPFDGQKDPYISMDSSIDYTNDYQSTIQNQYLLEGVLTGCTKQVLNTLRDDLVRSFDWKEDPTIPSKIEISGVVKGSQERQLIPQSIDFENSNYIGSLGYSIRLTVFTGIESEQTFEELINKAHTETTTIDEKGCISISTQISCSPNENLLECDALERANEWISGQLGQTKLGAITREKDLPLQNESLTINPITSEISYSSTHAHDCENIQNAGASQGGITGLQIALCSESSNENPECGNSIETTVYNGEVYKSGANSDELISYLDSEILNNYPKVNNLNTNYNNGQDSITFSFDIKTQSGEVIEEPVDYILNDYTITTENNYDSDTTSVSVNGTYSLLNSKELSKSVINNITNSEIQNFASSFASGKGLTNKSITRNTIEGTINYNFNFSSEDEDDEGLEGISGLNSYSINYTPPLQQYDVVPILNTGCDNLIINKGYASRGQLSISVTTVSGSGYDFLEVANDKLDSLKNRVNPTKQQLQVTDFTSGLSDQGRTLALNYAASFSGESAIDPDAPSGIISIFGSAPITSTTTTTTAAP